MSRPRRQVVLLLSAAALLCAAATLALSPAHATGSPRERACASYPAPGQLADRTAAVPAAITRNYRLFRSRDARSDTLDLKTLATPLQASGIVTSGIHYLGRTRAGYKLYAVPARHLTLYRIAPLRCFAGAARAVERHLLPTLERAYRHPAICIVETGVNTTYGSELENCGAPGSIQTAMLAAEGLPLVGLAPNTVSRVESVYMDAPMRMLTVHRNFYELQGGVAAQTPCSVEWLQESGNDLHQFDGCDYKTEELPEYARYQSFVTAQLAVVSEDVRALAASIGSGDRTSAEAAWITAHQAWLLIGQDDKQYGAFGNLGNSIDGTAAGDVGATTSPDFTGFHKIELDLWADDNLRTARTDAAALQTLIAKLIATPLSSELPDSNQGVANWLLRPHEILEDADRDTLTGDDDYGSNTAGAAIIADVAGVNEDLSLLAPTLRPLAPGLLSTLSRQLAAITRAAEATRVNGVWEGMEEMSASDRARLDAAVGGALENLDRIPDLLTSTGHAAPPT